MASLECAHEYQNALEEGPVRPGDLLDVPADLLNKFWVGKHGMPTSTVTAVVATVQVVRVQADGGQAGVSAVIEQYPHVLRIPPKHPCLATHVRLRPTGKPLARYLRV